MTGIGRNFFSPGVGTILCVYITPGKITPIPFKVIYPTCMMHISCTDKTLMCFLMRKKIGDFAIKRKEETRTWKQTSCNMPINSEKAQLSWLRRELRKGVEMSWELSSTSCTWRWNTDDGHGAVGKNYNHEIMWHSLLIKCYVTLQNQFIH